MRALTCGGIAAGTAGHSYSVRRPDKFGTLGEAVARFHAVPTASIPPGVTEREYLLDDGRVVRSPTAE
jgi:hypothetical protein